MQNKPGRENLMESGHLIKEVYRRRWISENWVVRVRGRYSSGLVNLTTARLLLRVMSILRPQTVH
jgi:hypothetical protein